MNKRKKDLKREDFDRAEKILKAMLKVPAPKN